MDIKALLRLPTPLIMPVQKTLELIKKNFENDDGFLEVDYIQIPVTCPYTLKRISVPCRTFECTHISCFDWKSFPQDCAVSKSRWYCPVCGKEAKDKSDIYVDGFFFEVLEAHETDCDIQVFPDLTCKALKDIEDEEPENNQSIIVINDSIIDLTNESIIDLTEADETIGSLNSTLIKD